MLIKKILTPSLFIHPRKHLTQTKEKSEQAIPKEFKWAHNRITIQDIFQNNPEKINIQEQKEFNKFINGIISGDIIPSIFTKNLVTYGFSPHEAQSILDQSLFHTTRAADWADDNEVNSGDAAKFILISMFLGIGKILLNSFDSIYGVVKNITGCLSNLSSALRGYKQFKIYGERIDEDRAENNYEGKMYGNKVSSTFADLAYLFETKINPFVLPILGFCSERIQDGFKPLLSLCNILWWRIRMPVEINQSFATDVLKFIIHKPLSLAGFERSKEILKEIDPDNVSFNYINQRLRSLIGLDSVKDKLTSTTSKLLTEFKSLFKGDTNEKISASVKINKFISPFLGFYGFFVALVGIPFNSICKLFNKESKLAEVFTQTSFTSQQLIYLFRLMLPEHLENTKTNKSTKDEGIIKLGKERKRTFYIGISVCIMNFASIFLNVFNFKNRFLNTGTKIYNEIADKGISYYLSRRRELLGRKFKLDNPELFMDRCVS